MTSAALGAERTYVFRTSAIPIAPHSVAVKVVPAPSPKVNGYVVEMSADIVDVKGRSRSGTDIMLHHAVFHNAGAQDATCPQWPDRFYATPEELWQLKLPSGYGYPNRATDRWGLYYMLMNHRHYPVTVYVQYKVRYVTGKKLTPVKPMWLDVRNCHRDPVFSAPGSGGPGAKIARSGTFPVSRSGRIVFAFGHLHGGGLRLELDNATCNERLFTSLPTWNGPDPQPRMHEPGPKHMTDFSLANGIPVAAGQKLRLRAIYDNSRLHVRAMGIMLAYLAPARVSGCAAMPRIPRDPLSHPGRPPVKPLPLLRQPTGPMVSGVRSTTVREFRFGQQQVRLPVGATFTWRFTGRLEHDVTVATGPEGFASDYTQSGTFSHRFTRPGTYNLFCSLHPALMTERIIVSAGTPAGTAADGAAGPYATIVRYLQALVG